MAVKQDLIEAVGRLAPLASAIVVLKENLEVVDELERRAAQAQATLVKVSETMASTEVSLAKTRQDRDQAKSEEVEAKRQAIQIVSDATTKASEIVVKAKVDANEAAKREIDKYTLEIAKLADDKAKAQSELATLDAAIARKRQDHNEVAAAVSVLQRRLAG